MTTTKHDLRERLRGERRALSRPELSRRSAALTRHLLGLDAYREASTIAGFVGVRGEPDTRAALEDALERGKQLYLPRVVSKTALAFARIDGLEELIPAAFGLHEPRDTAPMLASPAELDLVLVPGVAFDRAGGRLGQGGGYYDRFLAQTDAVRVGLCFTAFVDPPGGIPMEPTDLRVQWLVTEDGAVRCGTA